MAGRFPGAPSVDALWRVLAEGRETVSDLTEAEWAIEVSYEGSYELDEATLKDGSVLDTHFGAMGGWIAATLVRLGDLKFEFLPPEDDDDD